MTTRIDDKATRREMMRAGLAAVGGLATAAMANNARAQAPAPAKLAQTMVQYQTTPKNGAMCSTCVNFEAPSSCKIVAGTIVPTGWCIAYGPKT